MVAAGPGQAGSHTEPPSPRPERQPGWRGSQAPVRALGELAEPGVTTLTRGPTSPPRPRRVTLWAVTPPSPAVGVQAPSERVLHREESGASPASQVQKHSPSTATPRSDGEAGAAARQLPFSAAPILVPPSGKFPMVQTAPAVDAGGNHFIKRGSMLKLKKHFEKRFEGKYNQRKAPCPHKREK